MKRGSARLSRHIYEQMWDLVIKRNIESSNAGPRKMSRWEGEGEFWFEVVGESHYQDELESICGGRTKSGARFPCVATLVPEPKNRHDKKAVSVRISGCKVAHISRDDLEEYHEALRENGIKGQTVCCDALIVGGWTARSSREQGFFGVKLDLDWPPVLSDRKKPSSIFQGLKRGLGFVIVLITIAAMYGFIVQYA